MLHSHTHSCIFENIDVLMEHLSRSIDMGHHENLVQRVKIFGQRFGQFGLPVRHNIMVSKSMYTSPQNQQASVN
jgi:hypothetical protein